jgi:hypothetical protein
MRQAPSGDITDGDPGPAEVRQSLKGRQAPGQYEAVTSVVASQEQKHAEENRKLPSLRTD